MFFMICILMILNCFVPYHCSELLWSIIKEFKNSSTSHLVVPCVHLYVHNLSRLAVYLTNKLYLNWVFYRLSASIYIHWISAILFQVTRNGEPTRLIPSLDGGLYEFNGEDLNAIPMTAESLLSSSVRLTDNCVMVGGKEVGSYGVDIRTGQVR